MFIPLYDRVEYRHIKRPIGVYSILAANIIAFLLASSLPAGKMELGFGMIPAVVLGEAVLPGGLLHAPPVLTPFTSLFLHADIDHFIGNMLFLWVFGDNIEDAMGTARFMLFYVLCGACAAIAHALALPTSEAPLIGASGAVSGVIVAYLMLHPQVRVFGLVLKWIPISVKALYVIAAWIALQFAYAIFGGDPGVGWWAHVGGIVAGALLVVPFKRPDVSLFDRGKADLQSSR